jgi:hypothetical protein
MRPFAEDRELARHLAAQQPRPSASMKAADTGHQCGTVCRLLQGGHIFITLDGAEFSDRNATVFAHVRALARCGIAASDLMVGSRLEFSTKSARHADGKPEACDLSLIAVCCRRQHDPVATKVYRREPCRVRAQQDHSARSAALR